MITVKQIMAELFCVEYPRFLICHSVLAAYYTQVPFIDFSQTKYMTPQKLCTKIHACVCCSL